MDDAIEKLGVKSASTIRFRINPQSVLVGLAIAVVAYLTLVPLLMLIYGSLQSGQPGEAADFTLKNYLTLLGKWRLVPAFLNSLIFSFGASFLTFAGGLYLVTAIYTLLGAALRESRLATAPLA